MIYPKVKVIPSFCRSLELPRGIFSCSEVWCWAHYVHSEADLHLSGRFHNLRLRGQYWEMGGGTFCITNGALTFYPV